MLVAASCRVDGGPATLGAQVTSAFQTELSALVFALAVCLANPVPAAVAFDCTSAGGVAGVFAQTDACPTLGKAACDIQAVLRLLGRGPALYHVKSHAGHPMNCLADGIAKWAARDTNGCHVVPETLADANKEGLLPWFWTLFAPRGSLPEGSVSGKICDEGAGQKSSTLAQALAPYRAPPRVDCELSFKVVTYNCLTAASAAQRESIDGQLDKQGVAVAMLQETRASLSGRSQTAHYHVLSAAAKQGVGGCQLWFSKRAVIHTDGASPLCWNPQGFSIVHSSDSILLGLASVGGHKFLLASAHAPINKMPVAVKSTWWRGLNSALRRAPPNCTPLVGIDANAQLAAGPSDCTDNSHFFVELLRSHGLMHSPVADRNGRPFVTWTSPSGLQTCIDYLCVPSEIGSSLCSAWVWSGFVGQVAHDHKPVVASIQVRCKASGAGESPRCDFEFLRTPAGHRSLVNIYQSMPPVDWDIGVDEHLAAINLHLRGLGLRRACPSRPAMPRSKITSDVAWELIRHRRQLKRQLFHHKQHESHFTLRSFFAAWAGKAYTEVEAERCHDLRVAFAMKQVQDLNRCIKQRAALDSAEASRKAFAEARHRGPEALAGLLRQILKAGRRFKPPKLVPVIRDGSGAALADSEAALADHFAKAERAVLCDPVDLQLHAPTALSHDIPVCDGISLSSVALSFGSLADHKAAGLCGLPSEVFRHDALGAGLAFGPLVLKMCLRKQTPTLWRGGTMVSVPKPGKSPFSTSGWRAILLMEASAKGVHGALRSEVLRGYKQVREPAQGGSLPGQPLQVPMSIVRGFVRHLRQTSGCGGLLFLDGAAAFYSTLRESLFGTEHMHEASAIQELAQAIFPDEEARLEFLSLLLAPGLFESSGISEPARRILTSTLHRTFFVYGRNFDRVYQTRSGTVPGAPLADVCFQLAFSKVMAQVRQAIVDEGLEVRVSPTAEEESSLPRGLSVPATSWMDDLAVPVRAAAPADLLNNAGRTLQVIEAAISKIGVALNFGAGKSEFLPILCGPGSRKAREDVLGRSGGTFAVKLQGGVVQVTLTRSYVHLGSVVDTTASDLPDIRRRASLARELSISLKRLLHNPHLSLSEKSNFLASMPLARLRHGAGFWALDTEQASQAFRSAYMEILRRAFRQVTGVTSKGRSDHEVCCGLQLLTPEEARAVDVIRHAGWLLQARSDVIQTFWLCQGAWRDECLRALGFLLPIFRRGADLLWQQLQQEPSLAKHWARRLTKVCRRRNSEVGASLLPQWRAQQDAAKAGWIFCRLPDSTEDLVGDHACRTCHKAFRSAAALASHASRVHGRTAEATLSTCGTRCEVCRTEFWSTGRLHQHICVRIPFAVRSRCRPT